jgi:glycosyltransferase involved in cell wall biosynthesis
MLKTKWGRALKPFVVAAIPAHNEEKTIAKVVLKAQRFVDKVVVCDDGSSDLTADIAKRVGAEWAKRANADIMVTLDGDGQHDPDEIPVLAEPVLEGKADIVIGSRLLDDVKKNGMPKYRRLGIKVITKLTGAASDYRFSDAQSGFRVYGRKALEGLRLFEDGMGVSVEALMEAKKQGLTVAEVPAGCNYHGLETSKRGPLRQGMSVLMSIIRLVVEDKPLLFLGLPGVVSLLVGGVFGVWMLQIYSLEHQIETNIALASMAFILMGLFALFTAITLYAISRLTQKLSER